MFMKKYTFHVSGTHCPSCKILIEDILNEQIGIDNTKVDLKNKTVSFETSLEEEASELVYLLNKKIEHNGYKLSLDKHHHKKEKDDVLWTALPIGLCIVLIFFLLQKSWILNIWIGGHLTPVTSFFIGIIASLSSCLAVVWWLVLSLSAKISQEKKESKQIFYFFHFGRLTWFAFFGWILGFIGQSIGINFTISSLIGILASLVMILLGLNLVGVLESRTIHFPSWIFAFFRKGEHEIYSPLFLGIWTFFLPCGFTQSMQVAALSSGSFISGMFIMLSFSLWTFPVLFLLSFGSEQFAHSKYAPLFFKTSGVVVIGLGLFAFLAGLAWLGVIEPLFNI